MIIMIIIVKNITATIVLVTEIVIFIVLEESIERRKIVNRNKLLLVYLTGSFTNCFPTITSRCTLSSTIISYNSTIVHCKRL